MSDNRNHKESVEEKLERLGACGMGYPSQGLPCVRPKDHSNPISDCFALLEKPDGKVWGVYMQQDGKEWVDDQTQFPTDLVISTPLFKERTTYRLPGEDDALPDRRGLVAHSKGKPCNP